MRSITVLAAVAFAAFVVVMGHAGPAYSAQSTVAVSNLGTAVDTVVGTQSTVPAQQVRGAMRGGGGMHFGGARMRGFRSGGFRSFHAARFNRFNRFNRFHRFRFRHRRFFRPFVFGSVAAPYYSSYYNDCVWDGYQWVCGDDLY